MVPRLQRATWMMSVLVPLALVTTMFVARTVSADPVRPDRAAIGLQLAADDKGFGIVPDVSVRIAGPVFAHALGLWGGGWINEEGSYRMYRAGLEVRHDARRFHAFAGIDAGWVHSTVHNVHRELDETRGWLVAPRAGIELGGHVRFRASVEYHLIIGGTPDSKPGPSVMIGFAGAF